MSFKNYVAKKLKLEEAYYQFSCCSYYLYTCDSNVYKSFEEYCNDFKNCLKDKEYLNNVDNPVEFYSLGKETK